LAADAGRLRDEVLEVASAGARLIHVDVMDGHFVSGLGFGPRTVAALRETLDGTGVLLDVHLMVDRPELQIAQFAAAGADLITLHAEATPWLRQAVTWVHEAGCLAGAAICPPTPPAALVDVADLVDVALCMTVPPGAGGQRFLASSPDRVAILAALVGTRVRI